MSKTEKRIAAWALTQAVDALIKREGQRQGWLWWQMELLKLGAAFVIAEVI